MHTARLTCAFAILALAPLATWAVPDGPMPSRNAPETSQDPKTIARNSYNAGHEAVQSVAKLEAEAASMPAMASQYRDSIRANLEKARDSFRKAVAADAQMKEGWNMLGFTSRKLGQYEESLTAYEKALALAPDYPEAIEYRAELFLLTGRLAQTRESYARLQKLEPSYAGTLKTSMQDFLKANKAFPASVTQKEREEFAAWVASL
ncbi:MAG: tetratricopeptide repeat protein [Pseudomonadota bacterium]|nr:tetratricopeptide repeat protein [Pseudomonadota bacterium]